MSAVIRMIPLAELRRGQDERFQHREGGLDPRHLRELAPVLDALTPPVVFWDQGGQVYWFPDGFHRFRVHEDAGHEAMSCEVRQGDWLEAFTYSLSANTVSALARGERGLKNAILTALAVNEEQGLGWSERAIARACDCSHTHVRRVLEKLRGKEKVEPALQPPPPEAPPDLVFAERLGREAAAEAAELRGQVADPYRTARDGLARAVEAMTRWLTALGYYDEIHPVTEGRSQYSLRQVTEAVKAAVWPEKEGAG